MLRNLFTTALATLALVVGGLVLSAPAQAEWSRPGDLTKYRVCRATTDGGDGWRFMSKVRKGEAPDARAGIIVHAGDTRRARWSTGWLDKGETQISTVRVKKSADVEVTIWQEAGDRDDEMIGTAAQAITLKPRQIRHC